jgi:hypothetical protein
MMFEARRPSTRWSRAAALVPALSASAATAQALRVSRVPTWRTLSAAIVVWLLLPIAAHGQERTPEWFVPEGGGASGHVSTDAVITSVGLNSGSTTVDFLTSSHDGFGVASVPISGFPTEGSTFFVISSGFVASAPNPPNANTCCTSGLLDGLDNSEGEDLVSISFEMTPPASAQCLSFDFKFFSEEFPDFVGGSFNDTFLAETPTSTFTIAEGNVTAPNNVAFDSNANPITINSVFGMSLANASGTTYNGATPTLTTDVPIALGSESVTIVFSIMDLGDSGYDSTAFIDNVRWGDADCEIITETPTPTPAPQEGDLVKIYHSSDPGGVPECAPGGPSCVEPITGGAGDTLELWIDGGNDAGLPEKTVCRFGPTGSMGDNLCGADILMQMENGHFTGIEPIIDTLICNPSCSDCDEETGICDFANTTSIRMNFRRGAAHAPPNPPPPLGPRHVANINFDSTSNSAEMPTQIFANGVEAVGANLQVRRIANAVDLCASNGQPFSCCTGNNMGDGQWPCGARMVAPVPEPGQIWQLMSGLAGLGWLYRLRRRV